MTSLAPISPAAFIARARTSAFSEDMRRTSWVPGWQRWIAAEAIPIC